MHLLNYVCVCRACVSLGEFCELFSTENLINRQRICMKQHRQFRDILSKRLSSL